MYRHLRDFLAALESAGELLHITEEVSPYLEISKITDRESKLPGGGKALFFERVTGSAFPVATNIFRQHETHLHGSGREGSRRARPADQGVR